MRKWYSSCYSMDVTAFNNLLLKFDFIRQNSNSDIKIKCTRKNQVKVVQMRNSIQYINARLNFQAEKIIVASLYEFLAKILTEYMGYCTRTVLLLKKLGLEYLRIEMVCHTFASKRLLLNTLMPFYQFQQQQHRLGVNQ